MLEYTQAGGKGALMMLVLHDDPTREYAYGPAEGLPASKIGMFPQSLYDEVKSKGWNVISMKNDWKRSFRNELQFSGNHHHGNKAMRRSVVLLRRRSGIPDGARQMLRTARYSRGTRVNSQS